MGNEWKLYDCNSEEEYHYMLRKYEEEQEEEAQMQGQLDERNRIAQEYGFDEEINKLESELADYKKALGIACSKGNTNINWMAIYNEKNEYRDTTGCRTLEDWFLKLAKEQRGAE